MSLATRCTSCNTVFRVVQDQLKVSEGWVRCGRCDAVFNALEGLFDLEPPQPAPTPPQPAADAPVVLDTPEAGPREPLFVEVPPEPATPASRVDEQDRIAFADARFNIELLAEAGIDTGESSLDSRPASAADNVADLRAEPEFVAEAPPPEFMRQAERRARWTSPGARLALALTSLALLALLAAQAALHYRNLVVTLFPDTRPALQALCDLTGCRIEPLRRIDDIVIESSALNALPGGDAVRLSVVLRNRGVFPLALPAIELTLTDGAGQMIARRILTPADFGSTGAAAVLPAASEAPLQLVLTTSGRRASGYTVEPFYP